MIHVDKDARVEMSGTPKQICEELGVAMYSLLENCSSSPRMMTMRKKPALTS